MTIKLKHCFLFRRLALGLFFSFFTTIFFFTPAFADPPKGAPYTNEVHERMVGNMPPAARVELSPEQMPSQTDKDILDLFYLGGKESHKKYLEYLERANGDSEKAKKDFFRAVDGGLVSFDYPVGRVKVTFVDKQLTIRVHHFKQDRNVVFVGSDFKSFHLNQFANRLRRTRHTDFVRVKENSLIKQKSFSKPETFREKLNAFWASVSVPTEKKQTRFAVVVGSIQSLLMLGSGRLSMYIGDTASMEPKVFLMSGVSLFFGVLLTAKGKTVKNIVIEAARNSFERFAFSSSISFFAKYAYYSLKYTIVDKVGMTPFFALPALTVNGMTENVHFHIFSNTLFSTISKTAWYSFPSLWESLNKGREGVVFKVGSKEYDLGISQNQLLFNSIYLIPFIMSKIDLVFRGEVTLPFNIPYYGNTMEAGRALMIASTVVAIALNSVLLRGIQWHAKRKARRTGEVFDEEFSQKVDEFILDRRKQSKQTLKRVLLSPFKAVKSTAVKAIDMSMCSLRFVGSGNVVF